ncbi:MAG: LysM peptidoglycan-binding domain-containing protein, partial [Anaerolineaceae bacterium]|nr:LysM peptidoglycan-binding domain-containing protein [Anaerolineaceae bacterium]
MIVSGSGGNDPSTPVASEISPTVEPTETVQVTEDTAPTFVQPTPSVNNTALPPVIYTSQAGDYLQAVAARFGVKPEDIKSGDEIPTDGLITPGQVLIIPDVLDIHTSTTRVLPDSEVVFSPSALDFNTQEFVNEAGGYLKDYKEYLSSGWANGAQVINRVAIENSINPRILLALVEY